VADEDIYDVLLINTNMRQIHPRGEINVQRLSIPDWQNPVKITRIMLIITNTDLCIGIGTCVGVHFRNLIAFPLREGPL
jgi:hypothetical protein